MQLILKFRNVLPNLIVQELDNIVATVRAFFGVQHKEDGTHGNLTADSITVSGPIYTGTPPTPIFGADGKLPNLGPMYVTDARIDGPAMLTVDPGSHRGHVQQSPTDLLLGNNLWNNGAAGWQRDDIAQTGQLVQIAASGLYFYTTPAGANPATITRMFGVDGLGGIYERGRATPLGEWIAEPYNAANFAAATGTWTVASGNIPTYHYSLVGKSLSLTTVIGPGTVSAATIALYLRVPGGYLAARQVQCPYVVYNSGVWTAALCTIMPGGNQFTLYPNMAATGTLPAGTTYVCLNVTLPIQ